MRVRDVAAALATTQESRAPFYSSYWWGEYGNICSVQATLDGVVEQVRFGTQFPHAASFDGLRYGMNAMQVRRFGAFAPVPRTDLMPGVIQLAADWGSGVRCTATLKDDRLINVHLDSPELEQRRADAIAAYRAKTEAAVARERTAERWVELNDPEDILDFWVANPVHPPDGPLYARYAAWLRSGSPDTWHEAALSLWYHGYAPLFWIIRQPRCDMATALGLYYRYCGSSARLNGADRSKVYETEAYDLTEECRERLHAEFYTRQEIAFDGVRAFEQNFGVDAPLLDDAVLKCRLEGRTVIPEYPHMYNGMPDEWLREFAQASD
jgi:hypothetical protein